MIVCRQWRKYKGTFRPGIVVATFERRPYARKALDQQDIVPWTLEIATTTATTTDPAMLIPGEETITSPAAIEVVSDPNIRVLMTDVSPTLLV